MSIRKEEQISHQSSEEIDRKSPSQFRKTFKVYDPSICAGHPNCRECINILC